MQFPRFVYKGKNIFKLAQNPIEYSALLSVGWSSSVPEALGLIKSESSPVQEPAQKSLREILEAKALAAGVKIDRRWTEKRIAAMLEKVKRNGLD